MKKQAQRPAPRVGFAGAPVCGYGPDAVRTVTYRFDDPRSLLRALREGDLELPLPEGASVKDGEWVMATFSVASASLSPGTPSEGETTAAARGFDRGDDDLVLTFEPRDWERLVAFADGSA